MAVIGKVWIRYLELVCTRSSMKKENKELLDDMREEIKRRSKGTQNRDTGTLWKAKDPKVQGLGDLVVERSIDS